MRLNECWSHAIVSATTRLFPRVGLPTQPEPLTWTNIHKTQTFILPYFFMAYLTRRRGTYIPRLLLLPLVVLLVLRCTLQYRVENITYGWVDWCRGLVACALISKAVQFAVVPAGTLKVGEDRLPNRRLRSAERKDSDSESLTGVARYLLPCIYDALEVGLLVRGIGWQFADGAHVPRARRPAERNAYLKQTALLVLRNFLFADLCDSSIELLPGITKDGGTIFLPSLSPVPRYLLSTAIQFMVGMFIILSIEMHYDVASLVGVGLFHHSPALWPPSHDEPWRMSSLHEFWSKRWHQALRSIFLTMGGYPGKWIAGDVGMLFGTFLASGLFHELGFHLGGAPFDIKVLIFFVAQAVGILAEKTYRTITGRRVGGWMGTLWGSMFLLGLGQICTDSWVARGAAGRAIVPPALSPARRFFLPALRLIILRL
ncbi:hypothetical protein C8Q77DRAFT_548612 [Trametes polyzona]|nr:hypothetical protein C8Q77DRAFT_548612 [Trametes polyzona]